MINVLGSRRYCRGVQTGVENSKLIGQMNSSVLLLWLSTSEQDIVQSFHYVLVTVLGPGVV